MFRKFVLLSLVLAVIGFLVELFRAKKTGIKVGDLIKKDFGTVKTKVSVATGKFLENVNAGAGALSDTIKEARGEKNPLPAFIKNGVCKKSEQEICNLGRACDACVFNKEVI